MRMECAEVTWCYVHHFSLFLYLARGTKTPPTSGTTGGGNVDVGRLDGEKTAAIVAPIMIVALIIVVVIVIAVTVVVIYRMHRCDVCLYTVVDFSLLPALCLPTKRSSPPSSSLIHTSPPHFLLSPY